LGEGAGHLNSYDVVQDLSKLEMTVSPSRKIVTQTLNEFKSAGIIDMGRKQIAVFYVDILKEMVRF
jgi:hypothetical protein